MASPELGSKQICPTCQAKFYDLNKRPAHCPKCQSEFDPDEAVRSRRTRVRPLPPETDDERVDQVSPDEMDGEEEEEDEKTPELDEAADDPVLASDDDEDGDAAPSPQGEDLAGFSEDEEALEDDADVPFLEDEDDDEFDDSEIDGLPGEDDDDR